MTATRRRRGAFAILARLARAARPMAAAPRGRRDPVLGMDLPILALVLAGLLTVVWLVLAS